LFFFWSFADAAVLNRDPAILRSGLMRCVVHLQEEPALERALDGGIKPHPASSNK
jgi:hypothetical protein